MTVAVLGLASYGLSYAAGTHGWNVRFAALAALIAGFALLPTQKPPMLAVAALAAMGFLDALSTTVSATNGRWALTAIALVNGAQATAAVVALVRWRAASPTRYADYQAYLDYYNQLALYYSAQHSAEHGASEADQAAAQGAAAVPTQAWAVAPHGDYAESSGARAAVTLGGHGSSSPHDYGEPASGAQTAGPQGDFGAGLPSAAPAPGPARAPGEGVHRNPPWTASP